MHDATENAPRFIAAFLDGCEAQAKNRKDVPDLDIVNEILHKRGAGYQVVNGTVVATAEQMVEIEVEPLVVDPPKPVNDGALTRRDPGDELTRAYNRKAATEAGVHRSSILPAPGAELDRHLHTPEAVSLICGSGRAHGTT